ncbi:gpG [Escherichia phage ID2 Moscow/ID/2001]|uniref:Major spike protein G n=1 Tax=Escherichia phage ID2 Moscow/ID/2001 TaxID=511969 RepID=Q2LMC4_9VIRU|nr:gpG [Escherichia phage ID2 Moscow/ID/2001]AAZ48957.1 gpG [Escherichia phage ID2 Moscow/ID/2001]
MFQKFIKKHNAPLTSQPAISKAVTPSMTAAPLVTTPLGVSSTQLFLELTTTAAAGGFAYAIRVDNSNPTDNQVFSVCAHITSDVDPKYIACLVRFEVTAGTTPTAMPPVYDAYPIAGYYDAGSYTVEDCATIPTHAVSSGNDVYVGLMLFSRMWPVAKLSGIASLNQVNKEVTVLQPLK